MYLKVFRAMQKWREEQQDYNIYGFYCPIVISVGKRIFFIWSFYDDVSFSEAHLHDAARYQSQASQSFRDTSQ
jgi:hypothetical protein